MVCFVRPLDSFVVALQCNVFVSSYLKTLSKLLQGSHLNILEACSEINNTIETLENRPLKADETFAQIFQSTFGLTSLHGRETPVILRLAGRQKHSATIHLPLLLKNIGAYQFSFGFWIL